MSWRMRRRSGGIGDSENPAASLSPQSSIAAEEGEAYKVHPPVDSRARQKASMEVS